MGFIESPIFWIVLGALSEGLALIPQEKVKSNSLLQLGMSAINTLLKNKRGK